MRLAVMGSKAGGTACTLALKPNLVVFDADSLYSGFLPGASLPSSMCVAPCTGYTEGEASCMHHRETLRGHMLYVLLIGTEGRVARLPLTAATGKGVGKAKAKMVPSCNVKLQMRPAASSRIESTRAPRSFLL